MVNVLILMDLMSYVYRLIDLSLISFKTSSYCLRGFTNRHESSLVGWLYFISVMMAIILTLIRQRNLSAIKNVFVFIIM